ncbi:hypothetical protein ASG65_21490 [Bacillus sp. Leaf13]|nr:hypothetical protein ASG65_21490 [Bacillus sp. Leaf13]KRF60656.1 hypothetical protein ASG99_26230 [Bacillus sp. Soil768D1]
MMFSRWTFLQGIIVIILGILAFITDYFKKDMATSNPSNTVNTVQMLMTLLFIISVIGLFSLLMFFQSKKSNTFLLHPIWKKMHIIVSFLLVISIVVFISAFFISPLSEVIQSSRWILFITIYYFLFLINILVLTLINKIKKNTISNAKKIKSSFIWTVLLLFVTIFFI